MPPLPPNALATTQAPPGTTTRSSGPCCPQTNWMPAASTHGGGGPWGCGWAEATEAGASTPIETTARSVVSFMAPIISQVTPGTPTVIAAGLDRFGFVRSADL